MGTIEKAFEKLAGSAGRLQALESGMPPGREAREPTAANSSPGTGLSSPSPASPERRAPPVSKSAQRSHVVSRLLNIDLDSLKKVGFLTPDQDEANLAAEFRRIKRPILRNLKTTNQDESIHQNLIMVTSAMPSEGKTYTTLNLGISIAMEMDKTVLLVDCDLERQDLTRLLGVAEEPGLTDHLLGHASEFSEILLRTSIPKLTLLPAGARHPRATELLASEGMARLVNEMATRYPDRVILFDTPPLLVTTEGAVLTGLMGQTLVVVEARRTAQNRVRDALNMIVTRGVVGVVLNRMPKRAARYEGGYYGY